MKISRRTMLKAGAGTALALARGWKVSHFNRGKRDPAGVPGVET